MGLPGATGDDRFATIDAVQWPQNYGAFHSTGLPTKTISYSFETSRPSNLSDTAWLDVSGYSSYSAAERAAVRAALDHYEEMINVRFVEQATDLDIDLTFVKASQGVSGGRGRFEFSYFPLDYEGYVLFNSNRDVSRASDTYLILHEIGHALSLKHPGNYDVNPANAPPGPYLSVDEDNSRFTLMSYSENPQSGAFASSLMLYDIAGLQELWGANTATRGGNTSYRFGAELEAIWDAGGYDTITAAGMTEHMVIDLRQAHFSGFGGLDLLVVGYDVVIEAGEGGSGHDTLQGNTAANRLIGGAGNDTMYGREGADFLGGGAGMDRMFGGAGNDFYIVDNAGDVVTETLAYSQGGGIDTVRTYVSNYVQPDNVELVRLGVITGTNNLNATGNDAPGTLVGNAGNNLLTARGGNDQVNGNGGDDTLIGNTGRDTLVGGAGADTFVYSSISESRAGAANRDVINGFDRGSDLIDLSAMDANLGLPGDTFSFIGFGRFSGTAGELRLQTLGGPNAVLVEGDVRGDGVADFQIFVNLATALAASDFLL